MTTTTNNAAPLLQIGGGGPNPESVNAVRASINDILKSGAEQKTLRSALRALTSSLIGSPPSNTSVHSCSFIGAAEKHQPMSSDEPDLAASSDTELP